MSATQLEAAITSADIATGGGVLVTVFNPTPGGGTSLALTFTIDNPVPTTTSLSPLSVIAGGSGFTITVNGSNFVSGSVVDWNGSNRTTTYVTATQLQAAITAADIVAYGSASVTVTNGTPGGGTSNAQSFTINPAPQTISFNPLPNVTYGVSPITLGATASSGLKVSYGVSGPASLVGSTLTITGAGTVTVTASQAGNGTYSEATAVMQSFMVSPAVLTVTANNTSQLFGTSNPVFTSAITGFVNGDTISVVSGTATLTTTATSTSPVGTYPITFLTESLTAVNYSFTYVNGTLVVYDTSLPLGLWLSSNIATAGGAGFTLTVNGANFVSGSVVLWNGAVRATTYVSSTQLTAVISADDIATAGTDLVTVASPAPNAANSAAMPFEVVSETLEATIYGISIAVTVDDSGDHLLTVTGNNFLPSSTVQWNRMSVTATYVSPWQISAVVPASYYASLPATVTVTNPAGISPGFAVQ